MSIARVFPRQTKASPVDELAFYDTPGFFVPEVDSVHVSVSFTWDLSRAEYLADQWKHVAPVSIGGPATGMRGEDFTPGRYLKNGYVITSRGCPNRCWFCSVPKREGSIRELPISAGWNVLDDNLLACSDAHINAVFDMLERQRRKAEFTGGLEAARLKPWHVERLARLKPLQVFFAYDTPTDYEPLREASKMLLEAGFTARSHRLRCYVLIGYPTDSFAAAESRLRDTMKLGMLPMAMLWRGPDGTHSRDWMRFQREWSRPAIAAGKAAAGAQMTTKRKRGILSLP